MALEAEKIGTVEILRDRIYPVDAYTRDPQVTAVVSPGVYPLYECGDVRFWLMKGQLNLREARLGDGMFAIKPYDDPIDIPLWFPSRFYGPDEWREFIRMPVCVEGPEQRLCVAIDRYVLSEPQSN